MPCFCGDARVVGFAIWHACRGTATPALLVLNSFKCCVDLLFLAFLFAFLHCFILLAKIDRALWLSVPLEAHGCLHVHGWGAVTCAVFH